MKARPILFNGDMVRALLDGRKTQARRVIKPQPPANLTNCGAAWEAGFVDIECPHGQIGDLLHVRESYLAGFEYDENGLPTDRDRIFYRATDYDMQWYNGESDFPQETAPWKSSTQMPRSASRLTLRITSVRVERLQDISDTDAMAEGVESTAPRVYRDYAIQPANNEGYDYCRNAVDSFHSLWESINGSDSWAANPWVWALEFEVIHANVDAVIKEAA